MNLAQLDPATVQALAWVFGVLLFLLISFMLKMLYQLLAKLTENDIKNGMRLDSLEEDVESIHDHLFPVKYRKRKDT